VLGGLTGEQRVFLAWAQAWRGKVRDDFVRRRHLIDNRPASLMPSVRPAR